MWPHAAFAARNMAAEGRRAAALDRAHHLHLRVAEVALVGVTPSGAVIAEDIRDLQSWTGHGAAGYFGSSFLGVERRQLIERARHLAQHLARDVRVARRRVELGMARAHLDHANIDTLLQKMRGEDCAAACAATRASRSPPHRAVSRQTR